MFIDGVETMRYANPFKGETWYPLTNIAIKATPDAARSGHTKYRKSLTQNVRGLGLEPRTNWLKANCSTD